MIWMLIVGTINWDEGKLYNLRLAPCLRCEQTFDECRANASEANKFEAGPDEMYFCVPVEEGTQV